MEVTRRRPGRFLGGQRRELQTNYGSRQIRALWKQVCWNICVFVIASLVFEAQITKLELTTTLGFFLYFLASLRLK